MLLFSSLYSLSTQQNALISNKGWFEGTVWKWTLVWTRELSRDEPHQHNELLALLSHHHPLQNQTDSLLWKGHKNFTVKDLQQSVTMDIMIDSLVCTIWMNLAPPKVEFFMWLALLGKLNTKQKLCYKGILPSNQNACTFCESQPETLDHILLSCYKIKLIWSTIANELDQYLSFPNSFNEHYEEWMAVKWRSKISKKVWFSSFFAIAWSIWLMRNEIIFQQKEFNSRTICQTIRWRVAFWTKAWENNIPYTKDELTRNFSHIPAIFH